ncbi:MAG TPA: ATP-binding protein, partial [Polyangia bacterium]|nr:ATP-binding protein [Polyangia bacterium]
TERREHHADRISMEVQRQDTDDQLSKERHDLDVAATVLFETKGALAHSRGEHERGRDVLGMVAHDLRSPLCVIAMNSENIAETTHEDLTRDAAQDAARAAARMERIVTDLLDVVRIEAGTLQIVKRPHDVAKLVSEIRNTYEPLFTGRALTFNAPSPGPAMVGSFDHDRIVQVLSNLLGNAMKFTRPGGIIDLHVESRTAELEFSLHDDGPGIPAGALTEIFKRFSQLGSSERRGLGLGLYICQQIVVGHGGRIWAESEPGKGATFRFTLPL